MEYEMSSTNTTPVVFHQQQIQYSNNNDGGFAQKMRNFSSSRTNSSSTAAVGFPKKGKITDFFHVSRVPQKQRKSEKRDHLYIAAENVTAEDLMKSGGRATVTVNDKEIALVAHNNVVYAIEPKCPHAGGPLHLGDIEEIPGCGPCIKCPWHSWTFSLTSGRCIIPQDRSLAQNLQTFPVLLNASGSEIKVVFTEISPKVFRTLPE